MKSLFYSYNFNVEKAYIITLKNHPISEKKAKECFESCEKVGMVAEYWYAYNGIDKEIVVPDHLKDDPVMKMIKISDHYLVRTEVACALSHISLWSKCIQIDTPIVILEHDAIMVNPYNHHSLYNSICYLGSEEQFKLGWKVKPTPIHASDGPNYHFLCRAHAYAIDPVIAKNLLAYVLQNGICRSLDSMIRADLFPIHCMGVFAYDNKDTSTTIVGRSRDYRNNQRNDNLEF